MDLIIPDTAAFPEPTADEYLDRIERDGHIGTAQAIRGELWTLRAENERLTGRAALAEARRDELCESLKTDHEMRFHADGQEYHWFRNEAWDRLRAERDRLVVHIQVQDFGIFACRVGGGWEPRLCTDDPDDDIDEAWENWMQTAASNVTHPTKTAAIDAIACYLAEKGLLEVPHD
ncbi:MAG: hypothetical protein WC713_04260 [Candidatus Methylomirabilota bacterium]